MNVTCPKCDSQFDDEFRTTICPHGTFAANDGNNNFAHHPESHLAKKYQSGARVTTPGRLTTDKTVDTYDGDTVRAERVIVSWKNEVMWLAVGNGGQCYRKKDGLRTHLFCFENKHNHKQLLMEGEPFTFASVDELEEWMDGLNELRKANV